MARFNCFCPSWKKKNQREKAKDGDHGKNLQDLVNELQKPPVPGNQRSASFSLKAALKKAGSVPINAKVMNHESPVAADTSLVFEAKITNLESPGADDSLEATPQKNEYSDSDTHEASFQSPDAEKPELASFDSEDGHEKIEFCSSCKLKRSCSDLVTLGMNSQRHVQTTPKSISCRDIDISMEEEWKNAAISSVSAGAYSSPDRVILRKHSSLQILPSKSRSLWSKLLLWSNKNSYRARARKSLSIEKVPVIINLSSYASCSAEPSPSNESHKRCFGKSIFRDQWDNACEGSSSSPDPAISCALTRVNEWVIESCALPQDEIVDAEEEGGNAGLQSSPENRPSPARGSRNSPAKTVEEILHANTFIQSFDSYTNVAHISGVGISIIPSMSHFSSLRAVDLSGNSIVNITPGSLPKSLHVLDLSKNKIQTIEGLRELTRLRILNLSHNRISRIGQGLSSCAMIKELYLAGNKISMVEGLHRLLKLTVLDLSSNKITASKALGQLVANYNSLMALDLSGNPLHSHINNDQLRKIVCSLLPKLALLNKQPINQQKAREITEDAKAKGVLGNGVWKGKRTKSGKKLQSQWSSTSRLAQGSNKHSAKKMKQRSKSSNLAHNSSN